MLTIHFRNGKNTIVLTEPKSVTVPSLIAGLAEVLVDSQLATQEEIAGLRLAILREQVWDDISASTGSIANLGVTDSTVIGYTFSPDTPFSYEEYTP